MDHPDDQECGPSSPNPPPYSEKKPYDQQPPPAYTPANPAMPTLYQPYYVPYGAVPSSGPVLQPLLHTTVVIPVPPPHAPDYLAYSIFTMLFCCLPLGIGALVYSIRTRDANQMGNGTKAQRNSRMARTLAHSALFVGIVLAKIIIIYNVTLTTEENTWEEKKRRIRKKWSPYFDCIKEDEAMKDVHWKLWTLCP